VANLTQGFFQFNLFGDGSSLTGTIDIANAVALTKAAVTASSPSALPTTPVSVLNISTATPQVPPLTFTGTLAGTVVSYTASRAFSVVLVNFTIGF
jgi:hypothetical protein